jgi:hypothetical protein
MNHKRS